MQATATPRLRRFTAAAAGPGLERALARAHLTPMGLAVLALAVVGWALARFTGTRTLYLIAYATALGVLLSWVASRRRAAVSASRSELPVRVRAGQQVEAALTVTARRRVSTIVVTDELPVGVGAPVEIPISLLRSGEALAHRYAFSPTVRGVYQIGPVTLGWSDPFGFTTHRKVLLEPTEVIVHPRTEVVHDRVLTRMWEDPPVRPPSSKPWPVGFEFYGMRDYVPGDDVRRIVWSVVAKTGRIMVRESEQGITDRVVIVVDACGDRHSAGPVSETFETAIRAAASVGVRHIADGFTVTLVTSEGRVDGPFRGERSKLPFLDALARLQLGSAPLAAVGRTLLDLARERPHVLVVSPHVDLPVAQQLKLIVDRGVAVVVAGVIWDESDPASLSRAASLGCEVVQIPLGAPLDAVFSHQMRAGGVR